jgi:hypothetical protein
MHPLKKNSCLKSLPQLTGPQPPKYRPGAWGRRRGRHRLAVGGPNKSRGRRKCAAQHACSALHGRCSRSTRRGPAAVTAPARCRVDSLAKAGSWYRRQTPAGTNEQGRWLPSRAAGAGRGGVQACGRRGIFCWLRGRRRSRGSERARAIVGWPAGECQNGWAAVLRTSSTGQGGSLPTSRRPEVGRGGRHGRASAPRTA